MFPFNFIFSIFLCSVHTFAFDSSETVSSNMLLPQSCMWLWYWDPTTQTCLWHVHIPPLKSHSSFKNMFWLIQTFISAVEQKYASPWPPPNAAAAIDRLLFEWAGHNLDTFAWAAEEETAKNRCYYKAKLCFLSHVRYTSCLKASTGKTSCLTLCPEWTAANKVWCIMKTSCAFVPLMSCDNHMRPNVTV